MLQRSRRQLIALITVAVLGLIGSSAAASAQPAWNVDPSHTEINFSVNHFFTPVTGSFDDYEIELDYDAENPENSSVSARISVASIDTGNDRRNNHLRSGDFFEVETYPEMTFESTSVRKEGENQLIATGQLTIKGVSKEIELPITLLGVTEIPENMQQMFGKRVASFSASTTVDRRDFGVGVGNWAATLVVGADVEIEILLEANQK